MTTTTRSVERRPVVAYVLSLFDDTATPALAWERPVYRWHLGGMPFPPTEAEARQERMLRAETVEER